MPRWLALVILALVILRVGYHSAYLVDVPFSLATFSDGRMYEDAALDLVAHPPWGTEPFYLQGLYAYQLAAPMMVRPWITLALIFQLSLAGLGLWGLFRAVAGRWGRTSAGLSLVVMLAYPGLAFYENKYLTASLAVITCVAMVMALARLQRRPRPLAAVGLGVATGLAILARGNMVLAIPAVAVAAWCTWPGVGRGRTRVLLWLGLGLALSLGPMAWRNAVVTGRASVFPVHGGGTSFYIGNNRHARGVWNDAGGLLSGDVGQERRELAQRLGIPAGSKAEQSAAIGAALYRRAWDEIVAQPGHWAHLEGRKAWLMLGNDELSQDYDVRGEQELLPWWVGRGIPFSVVLALGLAGVVAVARRTRADPEFARQWRPWKWLLGGQVVAVLGANLLFFTSAQHRLPLVVPLVVLAAPGLRLLAARGAHAGGSTRVRALAWAVVVLVLVQGLWPRERTREPTAVHYYNLAVAHVRLGQPGEAVTALDRAIARRPDHPVIVVERATLHRRLGNLDRAAADLDTLQGLGALPSWVARRAADERRRVAALRQLESP